MLPEFSLEDLTVRRPWLTRMLLFVSGALLMLSFAPFGYFALAPLLIVPVLCAFYRLSPRQAAWSGFAFGAGLFLTGTYWLYVSIHVFGQAPVILAVFLMLGLVVIMALYCAATGWLVSRLARGSLWRFVVLAPAAWVLIEWLRGWVLSGFPWMTLGYSQIDSPLAGFAPLFGVFGISLMLLISASAMVGAILASGRERLILLALLAAPWIVGTMLSGINWTTPSGPAVRTTIVQGGVSQDRKWLPEQFRPTLDLYRNSILQHRDSDLVIWPEVALPTLLDQIERYVEILEADVIDVDTTLLFGILERDASREKVYNSVVALDGSERQVYRKRHLVPFGEYFPVPDFVREWMRLLNLPYSDISPGNDVQPLIKMPDGNELAVAICYEDAYAAEQLFAMPAATILINVSNDAWFGDSLAPHQHLEIARMRALEVGRSVVRATNNGVSAFIGPLGELLETGPQFEYLAMTRDVTPRSGLTVYARLGNWPPVTLSLVLVAAFYWRSKRA